MKIGAFVKRHIPAIFSCCEEHDPFELTRLQNLRLSKEVFDLNYPFCQPSLTISANEQVRYWTKDETGA